MKRSVSIPCFFLVCCCFDWRYNVFIKNCGPLPLFGFALIENSNSSPGIFVFTKNRVLLSQFTQPGFWPVVTRVLRRAG